MAVLILIENYVGQKWRDETIVWQQGEGEAAKSFILLNTQNIILDSCFLPMHLEHYACIVMAIELCFAFSMCWD